MAATTYVDVMRWLGKEFLQLTPALGAPDFDLFEEELMFSAIDALTETAYQ